MEFPSVSFIFFVLKHGAHRFLLGRRSRSGGGGSAGRRFRLRRRGHTVAVAGLPIVRHQRILQERFQHAQTESSCSYSLDTGQQVFVAHRCHIGLCESRIAATVGGGLVFVVDVHRKARRQVSRVLTRVRFQICTNDW